MHSLVLRRIFPSLRSSLGEFSQQVRCKGYKHPRQNLKRGMLENRLLEEHRTSPLSANPEIIPEEDDREMVQSTSTYYQKYPDFLPNPHPEYRDRLKEKLEREDMYRRRRHLHIPEFYVGSILAVTVADPYAPGKSTRFLGLCIQRRKYGLEHRIILRNVIDNQGIEIMYELYNPLIQKVELIRLERRLDSVLYYLRDCPLEYSHFPQDMEPQMFHRDMKVPVNDIKVPLGPRPWTERWERWNLKGIQPYKHLFRSKKALQKNMKNRKKPVITRPWEKEDIMKHYRKSIDPDTQQKIYTEVEKDMKNWVQKEKKI